MERFPLFYKQVARELAFKLAVIPRYLVKGDSFPACWRLVVVAPVPKKSSSSDDGHYTPISITPLLSKIFEKIVFWKLSNFWKVIPASFFSVIAYEEPGNM